jgi:hypothetical protein
LQWKLHLSDSKKNSGDLNKRDCHAPNRGVNKPS